MFYWWTIFWTPGIHCKGHRRKSNPTTQILLKPVSSSIKRREEPTTSRQTGLGFPSPMNLWLAMAWIMTDATVNSPTWVNCPAKDLSLTLTDPMIEKSKNPLRRIYDWTLSLAERKFSGLWLGLISFAEASFFPIPPDILLLPLCLGNLKKAFSFALICSVASVLGGLAGYAIGAFAWDGLSPWFFQYVPGFTEENLLGFRNGMQNGDGPWSFSPVSPQSPTKSSPLPVGYWVWPCFHLF